MRQEEVERERQHAQVMKISHSAKVYHDIIIFDLLTGHCKEMNRNSFLGNILYTHTK